MSETPGTTVPAKRGWVKYLLILSLGLNLLFVGLSAGAMLRRHPHQQFDGGRAISALGLRFYYRALDDGAKSALDAAIDGNRSRIRAGRDNYRAHLALLAEAIRAEPYDRTAVQAVLDAQAAAITGNIALGQELLLDRISAMPPKARQALADRLISASKHAKRRRD